MKFSQLKIGQPFLFRGNRYTKSGPLQATMDSHAQPQMIMRSANVEPLETVPAENQADQHQTEIIQALTSYHETALASIADDAPTAAESNRRRLNEKYQQLLEKLG